VSDQRALDALRLHPDAERVPVPDHGDLRALRESLRENGQQDPIDVTPDGVILDGRTRWTLLRELGAETICVRVVDIPEAQQVAYMVGRAKDRRHLTSHQKQDLNEWMRVQVVEERPTKRGNVMRIGHSQTQRAAALGVDLATVKRWETEPLVSANAPTSPLPTHAIDARGRPQPLHKAQPPSAPQRSAAPRPEPLRKARAIPSWSRHFSSWCRGARPEDREFLRRIDREVHAALGRNGIACERENAS
jgi:ParB-like chromosome segregation protein Spo0J